MEAPIFAFIPRTALKAVPHDAIAHAARDIEAAAIDLMRAVQTCETVSEALKLHALALTLEQEINRVGSAALERADAICIARN